MANNKEYLKKVVLDDEQYMRILKTNLAGRYSLESICPFYSSMQINNSSFAGQLSAQEIVNGIKNRCIDILSMENGESNIYLNGAKITIKDEYQDDDIRLINIDVENKHQHQSWLISNVDFSTEYQTYLVINNKDNEFYEKLSGDYAELRKAHNAFMDIVDRDFSTVDAVTMQALETLQILPECNNQQELFEIVSSIKASMIEFCKEFHIDIDATNTTPLDELMEVRNLGRDILRERGIDAIFNRQMDELLQNTVEQNHIEEPEYGRN